jgi:seryl-tRNA synthetase
MLDIKYLIENKTKVEKALAKKHTEFDIDGLIKSYEIYTDFKKQVDDLREEANNLNKEIGKTEGDKREEKIDKAKQIKDRLNSLGDNFKAAKADYRERMSQIHNIPHQSTPAGPDESGNQVIKKWGKPTVFDFKPKSHMELGEALDIIDKKRAVKMSGSRFTFLKNEAFSLQFGLVRYLEDKLTKKGYTPMVPPVMVKEKAMFGSGFFPAEKGEYYKTEEDDLYLVGTAEVPLASYHSGEILAKDNLPLKYMGYSSCFRREAGSYGKDTKGILRVHQFDKVEMFILADQDSSWDIYERELAKISEEILQDLKLPYQKVLMCGGDIGMPNAKKYDYEVWIPTQKKYRETMSCSHDSDFQARRLKIKYQDKDGQKKYVHTMNNTALAIGRTLIAILENNQNEDGSVTIPEVLRDYVKFNTIEPKNIN